MMDVRHRIIDYSADPPEVVAFLERLLEEGLVCEDCGGLLDDLVEEMPDAEAIFDRAEELALWPCECDGEGWHGDN